MAAPINEKNLDAVVVATTGTAIDTRGHPNISMVSTVSALATSSTILFQASSDGSNWFTVVQRGMSSLAGTTSSDEVTGKAYRYVRANCSTMTGVNTLTVYFTLNGNPGEGY